MLSETKANLKRLHSVWFHLSKIHVQQNYRDGDRIIGCQVTEIWGGGIKRQHMRISRSDGTVLYVDCGSGYRYLYMESTYIELYTYTHTHIHVKTDENWIRSVILLAPLYQCQLPGFAIVPQSYKMSSLGKTG